MNLAVLEFPVVFKGSVERRDSLHPERSPLMSLTFTQHLRDVSFWFFFNCFAKVVAKFWQSGHKTKFRHTSKTGYGKFAVTSLSLHRNTNYNIITWGPGVQYIMQIQHHVSDLIRPEQEAFYNVTTSQHTCATKEKSCLKGSCKPASAD